MLKNKINKIKILVLDFDGVLTDGFVYTDQDGKEMVRCSRRDTLGFEMLRERGIDVFVISKETNPVVESRCKKMRVRCWTGVDSADDKLNILKRLVRELNLKPENVCYVGDDVNDLACMEYAGVGMTVADGNRKNKKIAAYVTNKNGGDHAVREICDLILSIF